VIGSSVVAARQLSHREVSAMCCCLLDGSHPWLCRVEGYHHADLTPVQVMGHRHAIVVDRNVPVVAKVKERVV
jgi:hypothetical protein